MDLDISGYIHVDVRWKYHMLMLDVNDICVYTIEEPFGFTISKSKKYNATRR